MKGHDQACASLYEDGRLQQILELPVEIVLGHEQERFPGGLARALAFEARIFAAIVHVRPDGQQ